MIVQVFNKYLQLGGEQKSVERIRKHAREAGFDIKKCFFDSADWQGEGAPSNLQQLRMLFYNPKSAKKLNEVIDAEAPKCLLLHNIYPVGSPAVLDVAARRRIPVVQYVHNFRPFSVGGTLYAKGKYCPESLDGSFWNEIIGGAWQGSVLKSALMAMVLKKVQSSGNLDNVKAWICISEYMAEAFTRAGVCESKLHVLRHSWDIQEAGESEKELGYYLFLGRLTEEKGVRFLIDTWIELADQLEEQIPKLVLAGDGPMRNEVELVANNYHFIDYVGLVEGDMKHKLIQECRAMLAPSLWKEPLGIVTYEAQEARKVMFASDTGGLAETTEHGVTGFLHKPGGKKELGLQIVEFEKMTCEVRKKMGDAARNKLLNDASVELWQKHFSKIINSI